MKKVIVFFSSLILLVILLSFCEKIYATTVYNGINEKPAWVMSLKNNRYDVALLGSSRAISITDMRVIEKKTGLCSINIGSPGAAFIENYFTLKYFLQNGNHIKTLFLQADINSLMDMKVAYSYPFRDYLFFPHLSNDKELYAAVKKNTNYLRFLCRTYIPMFKYAEFNNIYSLNKLFFTDGKKFELYAKNKGSELLKNIPLHDSLLKKCDSLKYLQKSVSANAQSLFYFNRILDLAKEKNIDVVLYKAPIYDCSYKAMDINLLAEHFLDSAAAQRKLLYVDFQGLPVSKDPSKFEDYQHLNSSGAEIYSLAFADTINKINNKAGL